MTRLNEVLEEFPLHRLKALSAYSQGKPQQRQCPPGTAVAELRLLRLNDSTGIPMASFLPAGQCSPLSLFMRALVDCEGICRLLFLQNWELVPIRSEPQTKVPRIGQTGRCTQRDLMSKRKVGRWAGFVRRLKPKVQFCELTNFSELQPSLSVLF